MKSLALSIAFLGTLTGFWGGSVPVLLILYLGARALRGPSTGTALVVRNGLPRLWG